MLTYRANGNRIEGVDSNGNADPPLAFCDDAVLAAQKLNRAFYLNDVLRKYTASARLIAEVEQMPGFAWANPLD